MFELLLVLAIVVAVVSVCATILRMERDGTPLHKPLWRETDD